MAELSPNCWAAAIKYASHEFATQALDPEHIDKAVFIKSIVMLFRLYSYLFCLYPTRIRKFTPYRCVRAVQFILKELNPDDLHSIDMAAHSVCAVLCFWFDDLLVFMLWRAYPVHYSEYNSSVSCKLFGCVKVKYCGKHDLQLKLSLNTNCFMVYSKCVRWTVTTLFP